jgi:CheY-like chemotaxis protein
MRILVVEDDGDLREGLLIVLRHEGHRVVAAADGLDAWQELHEAQELPELLILDLMMPRMDGQTFRERQLAQPRLASIPTLVITARAVDAALRASLACPVLHKPMRLPWLLAELDEAIQPRGETKRCACGHVYERPGWERLPLVGEIDNGRGVGERIELRDCGCGSTLAWELGAHARSLAPPPSP